MYFIRSKGVDTLGQGKRAAGAIRRAHRGHLRDLEHGDNQVQAAWLSLSGLNKNGTGVISGVDQCGMKPDVAGVIVPKGDLHVQGNSFHPRRHSAGRHVEHVQLSSSRRSNIDWANVMSGSTLAGHHDSRRNVSAGVGVRRRYGLLAGDPHPDERLLAAEPRPWNDHRRQQLHDHRQQHVGRHRMVGGELTSNGNNTTAGATLSGLNFLIGGTPSTSSVDDATRTVRRPTSTTRATSRRRRSVCAATRRCRTAGWTTSHPGSPRGEVGIEEDGPDVVHSDHRLEDPAA